MKYKSLGAGLAIIAGVLIWQIISIAKTKPKSLISPSETVTGGTQQPAGDVSVEINYLAGKSDRNQIVFEISLNTHSVDLDGINFSKTVIMQKDGQTLLPLAVEASGSGLPAEAASFAEVATKVESAKAGHHRSAEVKFNRVSGPLKIIFLETPEVNQQEFEFRILEDRR